MVHQGRLAHTRNSMRGDNNGLASAYGFKRCQELLGLGGSADENGASVARQMSQACVLKRPRRCSRASAKPSQHSVGWRPLGWLGIEKIKGERLQFRVHSDCQFPR